MKVGSLGLNMCPSERLKSKFFAGFFGWLLGEHVAVAQINVAWHLGKWNQGLKAAVCPSSLILSHTHVVLAQVSGVFPFNDLHNSAGGAGALGGGAGPQGAKKKPDRSGGFSLKAGVFHARGWGNWFLFDCFICCN